MSNPASEGRGAALAGGALLLLALLAVGYLQGPVLGDPWTFQDDARHHLFWMRDWREGEVFRGDFLAEQQIVEHRLLGLSLRFGVGSPGFTLLHWLAARIVDPLAFNKGLPFALLAATVLFAFGLGRAWAKEAAARGVEFSGIRLGVLLAVLLALHNLGAPSSLNVTSALQRSFVYPLFLAYFYFGARRKPWWQGATILAAASLYPPTFVLLAALGAAQALLSLFSRQGRREVRLAPLLLALAWGALLVLWSCPGNYLADQGAGQNLSAIPLYGPNGRCPVFTETQADGAYPFWLVGRGGLFLHPRGLEGFLPLALAALLLLALCRGRFCPAPRGLAALALVGPGLYLLAWGAALVSGGFPLYYPSRYTDAPLPLLAIFLVALGFEALIARLRPRRLWREPYAWAAAALLVALLALWMPVWAVPSLVHVGPGERAWETRLAELPADSLIAGHPATLENVPLLAHRRAFLTKQLQRGTAEAEERTYLLFLALYETDPDRLVELSRQHGITHWLLEPWCFGEAYLRSERLYYDPFNGFLAAYTRERQPADFALAQVPQRLRLEFPDGAYLVSVADLATLPAAAEDRPAAEQ